MIKCERLENFIKLFIDNKLDFCDIDCRLSKIDIISFLQNEVLVEPKIYTFLAMAYQFYEDYDAMLNAIDLGIKNNVYECYALLGLCYQEGLGIDKDYKLSKKNYIISSKNNSYLGCYYLGRVYLDGMGNTEPDFDLAFSWISKSVELGYPKAMECLAGMYEDGNPILDLKLARKYYIRASKLGYAHSQYKLGYFYENGIACDADSELAIRWYNEAAKQDDCDAIITIGLAYYNGSIVPKNYAEAVRYFSLAQENNYSIGGYYLGKCYEFGQGVLKNPNNSFNYYLQSALGGHPRSMYEVAECFRFGFGVDKNLAKAIEWYEEGIKHEESDCYIALGLLYENGDGVERDIKKSYDLYLKAAELNNPRGECYVAIAYDDGLGVAIDKGLAFEWYLKAANHNNALAMYNLAKCYDNGKGVQANDEEAFNWYLKAANMGHVKACNDVGVSFRYGIGTEQNYEKAFHYFNIAANEGNYLGQCNLASLYESGLGTDKNSYKAFFYYEAASKNDDDNGRGKYELARCYEYGIGTQINMELALNYYLESAKCEYVDSYVKLGNIFQYGYKNIIEVNHKKAFYYYEKGVVNRVSKCYAYYGYFYENGLACEIDLEEAVYWYERASKQNDPYGLYLYAKALEKGIGIEKDTSLAFEYYLKAAENGNSDAQYYVALCYKNGINIDENMEEAFKYFNLAKNSNFEAMNYLGECYEYGKGVEKNTNLAFSLYLEAAEHNVTKGIYNVGRCYMEGIGIKKNLPAGLFRIHQAIDLNYSDAFLYLALWYLYGPIATNNHNEGFNLLKRASKLNNKNIIFQLGVCYLNGYGVKNNPSEAFKYFSEAHNMGSFDATYQLGKLYELGVGVPNDKNKAIELYEIAANNGIVFAKEALNSILLQEEQDELQRNKKAGDLGDSNACLYVANCYLNGNGTDKNLDEAFLWCNKAAKLLNKEAICLLASFYEKGIGTLINKNEAFKCYKKANDLLYPAGVYNLARCYLDGIGIEPNHNYSLVLYKKAANLNDVNALYYLGCKYINDKIGGSIQEGINYLRQGALLSDPRCQYQLGKCYLAGIGVPKDPNRAFEYIFKAANANNPVAQNELGLCYEYGVGTEINKNEAIVWFTKAAALGNEKAQNNLGRCYDEGVGVQKDPKNAFDSYYKSAIKGDTDAQLRIAEYYLLGYGVEKSEAEAFKWFEKASENNAVARFRLAELYLNGLGTTKNIEKALSYYKASSNLGYMPATEAYEKLNEEIQNKKAAKKLHLQPRKDVFISWNHNDKSLKDELCYVLEKNGLLTVWESDGDGSGEIDEAISMAINQAKSYIILVTQKSIESDWVKKEIQLIFDKVEKNQEYIECIRPIFVNTMTDGYVSFDTVEEVNKLDNDNPFKRLLSLCSGFSNSREQGIDYDKLIIFLKNAIEKSLKLDYKFTITAKFSVFNAALKNVIEIQGSKSGIIASTMDFNQGYLERDLFDESDNHITNYDIIENQNNVLIYGAGGTGKSLYLKNIIHKHFNGNNYIFYLPCREMDKYLENDDISFLEIVKKESFDNYFPDYSNLKVSLSGFEEILKSDNRVIILIDALDEITEKKKLNLLKKIDLFDNKYTTVKFIFSSRNLSDYYPITKRLNKPLLTYELRPLNDKDVSLLYDRLSTKMANNNENDTNVSKGIVKEKFFNAINGIAKEIIYNPLLLSNLIFIYFINNSIPNKKYDIIKQAVDIFIKGIDEERGTLFNYSEYIKGNGLNNILGEFAFERRIGNEEPSENIIEYHLRSIDEKMGRSLDKDYEAISEEIVWHLRRRSILAGENISHEIFRDYFTINYLFNLVYRIDRFGLKKGYTFKNDGLDQLMILTKDFFSMEEYPWPNLTNDFIVRLDSEIHVLDKKEMKDGNVSGKVFMKTLEVLLSEGQISNLAKAEIEKSINDGSLYFAEYIKEFI